ncbi:tetratricopeptide repeat protein [Atopobium fossor]|uniref:tetratricopeptide repeat protein n=1 Tax=Atopobium fossor TaxID=39487 RepID=UPI00041A1DE0|nr:tetratricopeptide repeat protein [Atopobium fossor]
MVQQVTNAQDQGLSLRDEAQLVFRRVQLSLSMNHPAQALSALEPLALKLDTFSQDGPDTAAGAYDFESPDQAFLFFALHPNLSVDDIRPAQAPYVDTYGALAAVLCALGRYEEALAALDKAIKWAPTDAGLYLEKAATHQQMELYEAVNKDLEDAWPLITRPLDMAHYHALRANALVALGKYDVAAAHYAVYRDFDPRDHFCSPHAELHELGHASGRGHASAHLSAQEAAARLKRTHEQYGASDMSLAVLQEVLNQGMQSGNMAAAKTAASQLYGLTGFDGWNQIIQKIDSISDKAADAASALAAEKPTAANIGASKLSNRGDHE